MAKYSTGGGGGGAGGSCELCGADGVDLETASVAGAQLQVCASCAQHGDTGGKSGGRRDDGSDTDRRMRAAQNAARMHDATKGDASHWESGADYEDDQLPYLVTDYATRIQEARQDAGYQLDELASELGVDERDLLALEQGRATQAGVGGSVVSALEAFLDVELVAGD